MFLIEGFINKKQKPKKPPTKTTIIKQVLAFLRDNHSEPMVGYPEIYRRLTFFGSKLDVVVNNIDINFYRSTNTALLVRFKGAKT